MRLAGWGKRNRRCVVIVLAMAALLQGAIGAADAADGQSRAPAQTPFSLSEALRQLTDPGGARTALEQAGLQFTFNYFGDAFTNPRGGVNQGQGYAGRFSTVVDADLEKLIGWTGALFHVSFQQIHGTLFSANRLQNLAPVSSVEAPASTRLFNLWMEQDFGPTVNLRVGQFTVGQEFLVSKSATLFVNSTFGWPLLPATDLPSGGPAYPEATLGARLAWTPNDQFRLRVAVFDGDPAGPELTNPVQRDPYGVAFRINDAPFIIAEVAYAHDQDKSARTENPNQEGDGSRQRDDATPARGDGLPGTVKFGGWLHSGKFGDQRFNSLGGLLASGGTPLQHAASFGIYGVVDQMLWRAPGNDNQRGLRGFVRVVAVPSDRNVVSWYLDAGLVYKGPLHSRPNDTVGFAVAYGHISSWASQSDRDLVAITGAAMPIRDYEAVLELTYQVQLAKNWWVQPTIQYIAHPGGHVPDPAVPSGAVSIPDALVLGVRTQVRF